MKVPPEMLTARMGGLVTAITELQDGRLAVSYTHLRAHETVLDLVCRLLLEKKKQSQNQSATHSIQLTRRLSEHCREL